MFTRNCLVVNDLGCVCLALLVTFVVNQAHAGNNQGNLGVHLTPALGQTPNLHIDSIISPDGLALPDGSGSATVAAAAARRPRRQRLARRRRAARRWRPRY